MRTIYKYALELKEGPQTIALPNHAEILHVDMKNGEILLWALVYPENSKVDREFIVFGTGWEVPEKTIYDHIATIVSQNGYVWHVFEIPDQLQASLRGFF